MVSFESFYVIGISVRTINKDGQAAKDIGSLWEKFMSEGIAAQIPNKLPEYGMFSIYSNYEGDHTQHYDTILGFRVSNIDTIPEGMVAHEVKGGNFEQFVVKGDLTKGAVYEKWLEIWQSDLNRSYTSDIEVYSERALNPEDAEVDIFISVKG